MSDKEHAARVRIASALADEFGRVVAEELTDLIAATCNLESALYRDESSNGYTKPDGGSYLFDLRKALEGLFGHGIPNDFDGANS